jgi:hypothetical protein
MKQVCMRSAFAALLVLSAATTELRGQTNFSVPSMPVMPSVPNGQGPPKKYMERFPEKASLEPSFSIPVSPMGFSIPGNSYLLRQQQLVSLDFIDENRLLFSFHVASGLREREAEGDQESRQRIHAVVVDIATGKAGAEADWAMPDRKRYLWMLNDGHFLLRTADGLEEGDAELKTKEYLRWPGRLMWIEMDPEQKYLVANSLEAGSGEQAASAAGSSSAEKLVDAGKPADKKDVLVIRTVRRDTGEVIRTTKAAWTSQTSDWPMNSEGYVETVHDKGAHWVMKFQPYGGSKGWAVAEADSVCIPQGAFVTDTELLVSRCDPQDGWKLRAWTTAGRTLWEMNIGSNTMWPLLMTARDGSRVAREMLVLKRSAEKYKTGVRIEDVQGQMVRVFDSATGKVVMETPIRPIYDGGGNVAVSPSGKRVAILNGDAIQVYELPAPRVILSLQK